jgi:hypothetical protein
MLNTSAGTLLTGGETIEQMRRWDERRRRRRRRRG